MKKILGFVCIFSFLTVFPLFSQQEEEGVAEAAVTENAEESVKEPEKELTKEEKKALKEKEAAEKKAQKEKEAQEEKERKEKEKAERKAQKEKEKEAKRLADIKRRLKKDEKLGIVYLPVKKTELAADKFKVSLDGKTGCFNIFAVNESKKAVPVLSSVDGSASSFIAVLAGDSEYRLNREAGVAAEAREVYETRHVQLAYSIEKQVQVTVDFVPAATVKNGKEDAVRVTVFTTNISDKPMTVGIRGMFDTILGENSDVHFKTSSGNRIKKEKLFESVKDDRWILSSNSRESVQFVLFGKDVSTPVQVAIANIDTLSSSTNWKPRVTSDRSLTSANAYNNSAVAVNWMPVKLDAGKTDAISFYIVLASDGELPNGAVFAKTAEEEALENANNPPPVEIVTSLKKPSAANTNNQPVQPQSENSLKQDQLNAAYVQALINRINNLESEPENVDRAEIQRLNAELDLIMKKIRQQL